MDISIVAIPIIVAIYMIGLLSFLRKLAVSRSEKKSVSAILVVLAIIGGAVSVLLIAIKLLQR